MTLYFQQKLGAFICLFVYIFLTEFLKGATVQSRNNFQRLRKIWGFERKNA